MSSYMCTFKGLGQIQADYSKPYVDSLAYPNNSLSVNHKYESENQNLEQKKNF